MSRTDEPVKDLVVKTGSVGNREYTAHWEANTYTITYDWNNSKDYFTYQDVVYDSNFTLINPTREGYKFLGWTDENGLYFEEGYYIIDNDITLTAQWELIQYNITYIMNGGTNSTNNPSTYNYENDTISLNEPTKNGYTFKGWTGENYNEPTLIVEIPAHSVNNRTYTAHWEANTYTITYDVNGGNELSEDVYQYTFDSTYTLLTPTREGYSFAGWYYENKLVESGKWKISKNSTLVAEWTIIEYNIYYELDGGTNDGSNPSTYTFETNDIVFASPEKIGYTFVGWTSVDQPTPVIDLVLPHNSTQDRTITAHWEANTYTIIYDVNGGNALSKDTQKVLYDDYYTLLVPTRPGYNFVCWEYNSSAFNEGQWKIAKDIELIAKWERITYNITYYLDGGTNNKSNPSNYNYDSDDIVLKSPEKEGYTFIGWTSLTNNVPVIEPVIEKNSLGNKIFTAHWEANTYTITYDVNGGNELSKDNQNVIFDSSYNLSIPTRTGYTFTGWYYNNSLVSNTGNWNIPEDCELEAKWTANQYTITIITSTGSKTYTATYDSSYTLTTQSKSGYYFDGYFLEQYGQGIRITDAYGKSIIPYTYTENITVYASFVYEVDFVSNGGEEIETVSYHENEYLDSTIVTTKEGKTFGGWYTNAKLTSKVSYSSSLGNKTLYARWEEEVLPSELTYTTSNGAITISDTTYAGTDLIIPSHIGGVPVTIIASSAFAKMTNITKVEIPNTVSSIGAAAFNGCSSIITMNLPFVGNTYKTNNDTYQYPFGYIFGTSSYTGGVSTQQNYYGNSISSSTYDYYYIPKTLTKVTITIQENLNRGAFQNCKYLVEVNVPDTLKIIEKYAFYGCTSLSKLNSNIDGAINIPIGVEIINNRAFFECSAIKEVQMSEDISYIGEYAFYKCNNILKFNTENENELLIPDSCETIENNAFNGLALIKNVRISDNVTYIGESSFGGFSSLESITLPFIGDKLKNSDDEYLYPLGYIFGTSSYNNSVLTTQSYLTTKASETTKYISTTNYYLPTSLTIINVTLQENFHYGTFDDCKFVAEINIPNSTKSIAKYAFTGCSSLSQLNSDDEGVINIPENIIRINDFTFYNCTSIKELQMSEDVVYIGEQAFYGCSNILKLNSENENELVVPNSCETIKRYAFNGLALIKSVRISDNVTYIGESSFGGFSSLESITLPFIGEENRSELNNDEYLYSLGYIFGTSSYSNSVSTSQTYKTSKANDEEWYINTSKYQIPKSLNSVIVTVQTSFNYGCFENCSYIEQITIPNETIFLGKNVFNNCSSLSKLNSNIDGVINIPIGVNKIQYKAFYNCSTIAEVYSSDTVEFIGDYAFYGCSNIVKFNSNNPYELNTSLNCESIGRQAFYNLNKIRKVNISDSVSSIGLYVFDRMSSIEELTIPYIPKLESESSTGLAYLFTYYDGSLTGMYSAGSNYSGKYKVPTSLTKINITKCENIPDYSFYNMTSLVEIVLPENTTYIGKYAFYGCKSLSKLNSDVDGVIEIPEKIKEINDYTFYNCSVISEIKLSQNVELIGDYAFSGCSNIVKFNSNNPYELVLPNECGIVESYAFSGMKQIKTVIFPNSLYSIGSNCLGGMTSLETLSVPYISDNSDSKLGIGRMFTYSSSSVTGMYSGGASSSYYRVPNTLTTINVTRQSVIPDYAFYNMTKVLEINLLSGASFSSNTFKNCNASINYVLDDPIHYDENTVWDGETVSEGYKQGTGTKEDPYIISNSIEFMYFVSQVNLGNTYLNTYFKLTNDINLNKKNFDSLEEFDGYFDGNGYTIKNIKLQNTNEYCGLFQKLGEKGYIVNLTIKFDTIEIIDNSSNVNNYIGPLVAYNNGIIQNCYVEGTISTTVTNSIYIGGIIGYNNGTISDSYSNVQITSISSVSYSYVGGIVGYNNGTINECFAIANVSSKGLTIAYSFVGGITGYSTLNGIINSYVLNTQSLTKYETKIELDNDNETIITILQIKDSLVELWDLKYWDFDYKYPGLIKQ